ncbi:alpha/beta hydrolase family protein [Scleromatobacter humisilvae]|uniref:Dipeptidyl aminopeptidase n=1 Tax=Scleromatobacter humisilvae TaxID=2897159 RepID=A0A9X2C1B3_9BURK|nr:dipeptidyl aminopeptidase [Scleromatobacter humisilvae]MCK9685594.1 dipeptidyl aminopeptidase [Scleromatobacter humisilvae]
MRRASLIVLAALAALPFAAGAVSRTAREAGGHEVTIAVREASGEVAQMGTTWFVPPGKGPFPVVLFSHGRPSGESGRKKLALGISRSQLKYWLGKGVAVVSPVRPGYGDSTGGDVELSGVHHDAHGRCTGTPDYRRTADAAVLSIQAALQWIGQQPWADAKDVLLVGQSVGGLATVAAAAQPLPGVVGYVNFAGGSGGNPELSPGVSCDPGQIEAMVAAYAKTTTAPSLWIYAMNDQYWGPDVPVASHAAFARGGSRTTFVHAPAVPDGDGHGLSRHDASLWAPAVDAFIARLPFPHPH